MREIRATKPHNLGQLLDELEAGVPALRPVVVGGERQAVMSVTGRGQEIAVLVPDETSAADVSAVGAVIAAHVARAPATPSDLRALWTTYKTNVQAATTVPQIKAALVNDLGPLLRAVARGNQGDIDGA